MSYRILKISELRDPGDMQPAIVLDSPINDVARHLNAHPTLIDGDERSWRLLVDLDGVQLAMIAYEGDPGFVHIYVTDNAIQDRGPFKFEKLLSKLPLRHVKAGWWERKDVPGWPGNHHRSFVINSKYATGGAGPGGDYSNA
ncbi:hypothetical protein [Paraburkholderia sp. BL25I1N1]|uniref:hypothetical protein n=1 Tax=Paraburkholderia sp. BL25I1N1 TaxID=1938804 RepID=UPI000D07DF49|nr:hypothetical protein [Paraburkholderia sp. BL25I1N1]PRY07056.1 hypothetical protein B0G73_105198 [Paraburkholderia sp. BL25I1N1]